MRLRKTTPPEAIYEGIILQRMGDKRDRLEADIRVQVAQVIQAGGRWSAVGIALGTSTQAAWERYAPHPPLTSCAIGGSRPDSEVPLSMRVPKGRSKLRDVSRYPNSDCQADQD